MGYYLPVFKILHYVDATGCDVVTEWLSRLPDSMARARILARLDRLAAGNFGDCKPLHGGVSELRIHHGSGYRVYYARVGKAMVLLLCGGDKRRQQADIERAIDYLDDWRMRS
jgi:putative addiction module killer protein